MVTTGATFAVLPSCAPWIASDGTRLGSFLATVESRTMPSGQEANGPSGVSRHAADDRHLGDRSWALMAAYGRANCDHLARRSAVLVR